MQAKEYIEMGVRAEADGISALKGESAVEEKFFGLLLIPSDTIRDQHGRGDRGNVPWCFISSAYHR